MAKPYYQKGRPFDIDHITILLADARKVCKKEKIDDSLLLPLVILHDIGYGITGPVYFEKKNKKKHMVAGAKLAKAILREAGYPRDKIKKIVYWISIHDNWIYGDTNIYRKNPILAVFNDLEFIWMATPKGLRLMAKTIFGGNTKKMLKYIVNEEKHSARLFSTKTTEALYQKYIHDAKKHR